MIKKIFFLFVITMLNVSCFSETNNLQKYIDNYKSIELSLQQSNNDQNNVLVDSLKGKINNKQNVELIENIAIAIEIKTGIEKNLKGKETSDENELKKYLDLAIKLKSKNPIMYYLRGQLYYEEKNYKEALNDLEKANELGIFDIYESILEYQSSGVYFNFYKVYLENDNLDKAEEYLKKSVFFNQLDPMSYYILTAFYFHAKKEIDKAREYGEIGVAITNYGTVTSNEFKGRMNFLLGRIYEEKGFLGDAIKSYELAIEFDNTNEKAKERLKTLKSK